MSSTGKKASFRVKLQRVRSVGIKHLAPVLGARILHTVQHKKIMRGIMDRRWRIEDKHLLHAVDFSSARKGDWKTCLIQNNPAHYFLDHPEETAHLVQETFPDSVARTLEVADAACAHTFSFLGKSVHFEGSVNWAWLPEREGNWPALHADDYGHGFWAKEERLGDAKYPWELNRHQYFVALAKAWHYTGDERYVREVVSQLVHWLEMNPFRYGINWTSEMEFGIRMISWINTFWLLRHSPFFQEHGLEPMIRGLYQHARYLADNLTTHWFVRSNHVLGESAGLFLFSVLFPMFKESSRWRKRALRVFTRELQRQIAPDGVNLEQATGYHRFVVDFLLLVVYSAELNTVPLPPVLLERLERMLFYESVVTGPDGHVPLVGDVDNGRGLLLSESVSFDDFRGWLAVGAVRFNRPDLAVVSDGGNEESLWMLGPVGWEQFQKMPRHENAAPGSFYFPDGGQAVLRIGPRKKATMLHIRCGSFGLGGDGASSHSHSDMLAPVIYWKGMPLAVDTGTFFYYGDTEIRDASRAASAHNTMTPRGMDQAVMHPIWDWSQVPETRVTEWKVEPDRIHLEAVLEAPQGFTHRRGFLLDKDGILIEDYLRLDTENIEPVMEWRLHLAPGIQVEPGEENTLLITGKNGMRICARYHGFQHHILEDCFFYPGYGVRVKNRKIILVAHGKEVNARVRFVSQL